jgi:hypothetical protein
VTDARLSDASLKSANESLKTCKLARMSFPRIPYARCALLDILESTDCDVPPSTRKGSGVLQRLRWLDDRICWVGTFRRSDYSAKQAISEAQA